MVAWQLFEGTFIGQGPMYENGRSPIHVGDRIRVGVVLNSSMPRMGNYKKKRRLQPREGAVEQDMEAEVLSNWAISHADFFLFCQLVINSVLVSSHTMNSRGIARPRNSEHWTFVKTNLPPVPLSHQHWGSSSYNVSVGSTSFNGSVPKKSRKMTLDYFTLITLIGKMIKIIIFWDFPLHGVTFFSY